jgi:di/tricarboxylate transporter
LFWFRRPFSFNGEQAALLGVLLQVILCWAANIISRDIVSVYLLVCFLCIGDAKPQGVFNFIFSRNFIFIVASFLISAAITNTGLAGRAARFTFKRFAKSPVSVLRFSFVAGTLSIFLIPQSFPRVILMASLYQSFFQTISISPRIKAALLYSIFFAATAASALFINGDVVLNYASLGFAGASLSYTGWITYMFVPSLILMILAYLVFKGLFGISRTPFEFTPDREPENKAPEEAAKLSRDEKKVIISSAVLIALWLTESLHGIPAAYSAGIMVILFFILRLLHLRDLKSINPSLILFLTAAFSIGRVLSENGIASAVTGYVFNILPAEESPFFFPVVTIVIMALHFVLGSAVTTLSVVVPALTALTENYTPAMTALLAFTVINMQYFLPMHHITVMIGAGKGYYSQRETLKTGVCFFFIMIFFVPWVLLPWWRFLF